MDIFLYSYSIIFPYVFFILVIINIFFLIMHRKKIFVIGSFVLSFAIFTAITLYLFNYTVDDTYISLRYARNLFNGYGMVFNTDGSKSVEGYTNFLWIILEYFLFHLNLSESILTYVIKIVGYFFGCGFILLVIVFTRQLSDKEIHSQIACFIFSLVPNFSLWSIAGLETSLFLFLLLLSLSTVLFELKRNKNDILSSIFLLLLSLTRPEGLIISLTIFLSSLLSRRDLNKSFLKKFLPGLLLFICLYSVYFFWTYNYFGYLLPNSFYAKRNKTGILGIVNRFSELIPFYKFYLPILILNVIYFFSKKTSNFLKALFIIMQGMPFIASREWMPGFRYELPLLSITIPFAVIIFEEILCLFKASNIANILKNKSFQTILFVIIIFFCGIYSLSATTTLKQEVDDYMVIMNQSLSPIAKWLQKYSPQNATYADFNMGLIPYVSRINSIIDIHEEGLLNIRTTHYGYDEQYLLSLKPSFFTILAGSSIANSEELKNNYIHVIRTKYKNKFLDVYVRKNVELSSNAFIEGEQITKKSLE